MSSKAWHSEHIHLVDQIGLDVRFAALAISGIAIVSISPCGVESTKSDAAYSLQAYIMENGF